MTQVYSSEPYHFDHYQKEGSLEPITRFANWTESKCRVRMCSEHYIKIKIYKSDFICFVVS